MAKVINMSEDIYPLHEFIEDLTGNVPVIQDLLTVSINKDGTANVAHTGLPIQHLALAALLIIYEALEGIRVEKENEA